MAKKTHPTLDRVREPIGQVSSHGCFGADVDSVSFICTVCPDVISTAASLCVRAFMYVQATTRLQKLHPIDRIAAEMQLPTSGGRTGGMQHAGGAVHAR